MGKRAVISGTEIISDIEKVLEKAAVGEVITVENLSKENADSMAKSFNKYYVRAAHVINGKGVDSDSYCLHIIKT